MLAKALLTKNYFADDLAAAFWTLRPALPLSFGNTLTSFFAQRTPSPLGASPVTITESIQRFPYPSQLSLQPGILFLQGSHHIVHHG